MKYDKYTTEDFLKDDFFITSMIDSDADGFWVDWINSSPDNLSAYYLAKQIIQSMEYGELKQPQETDYDQTLKNVIAMDRNLHESVNNRPAQKMLSLTNVWKVAASIALLIASIWAWNRYEPGIEISQKDQQTEEIIKTAPYGQKTTVRLSDGSKVIINSGGKIAYRKGFSGKERKIELAGEAYFEVAKDANRPFIVSARGISTMALGTSFNIRAFGDESNVIISLITGKVRVGQTEGFDVMLNPGDQLKYSTEGNTVEHNSFDTSKILAWTKGIISFENASMVEVTRALEKWYGVSFEFENSPDVEWNYSGQFENQSLANVLEHLSYSQKFQYEFNNKTIRLKF